MTFNNGHPAPSTQPKEARPHVCGKCRNPFTNGNPDCVNARPS